jgi:hypothetical protein
MSDIEHYLGDGPGAEWIRAHLDYPNKNWCLLWPFALDTNGYAHIQRENYAVHRLMCEYRNGPAPGDEYHAAHSCRRGHDGCVNQWHLDWKTPTQNQLDRAPKVSQRKLTTAQVDEIRALQGRASLVDIARQFGVSPTNIQQIHAGKTWTKGSSRSRVFTVDEILHIRSVPDSYTQVRLAKEYGVKKGVIQQIRSFTTYRWVEPLVTRPQQTGGDL